MKKTLSFLIALLLFLSTITGMHFYAISHMNFDSKSFSTWTNARKFAAPEPLRNNIAENTLTVFGSSEFNHCTEDAAHIKNIFNDTELQPLLIGAGYYQCLSHAITLASLGDSIRGKKAVLLLSPTWFRAPGVVDKAFASRFSESQFVDVLNSSNINDNTKNYIIKRTNKLLSTSDTAAYKRALSDERVCINNKATGKATLFDYINYNIGNAFRSESERIKLMISARLAGIYKAPASFSDSLPLVDAASGSIDWNSLLEEAEAYGEKNNNNEFYMSKLSYTAVKLCKDKMKNSNDGVTDCYAKSPEYDDFRCFLDICRELDVEINVITLPLNGYWYDFMGYGPETRIKYYNNIRSITTEYGVQLTDLSEYEFSKYFFEDGVHLDKKGWVILNEKINEFYNQD